jgi:hypothetical protein
VPNTVVRILSTAILALALAACGGVSTEQGPIEVNLDGYLGTIYFAPHNVRMFITGPEGKPVEWDNVNIRVSIGSDDEYGLNVPMQKKTTTIAVPAIMGAAVEGTRPLPTDETERDRVAGRLQERAFFWLPFPNTAIPEGVPARVSVNGLKGEKHALSIHTYVRYAFRIGYTCPNHPVRVFDEPGACPSDGIALEVVPSVRRCPSHPTVTGMESDESCWRCEQTLELSPLVVTQ